jgi:hypothetical protein
MVNAKFWANIRDGQSLLAKVNDAAFAVCV